MKPASMSLYASLGSFKKLGTRISSGNGEHFCFSFVTLFFHWDDTAMVRVSKKRLDIAAQVCRQLFTWPLILFLLCRSFFFLLLTSFFCLIGSHCPTCVSFAQACLIDRYGSKFSLFLYSK